MLLYDCKYAYYGLKTEENAFSISRQKSIETTIVDKFNYLLSLSDYNGEGLQKVDHDPKICF